MNHSPFKWTLLLLITSYLTEEILAENNCKSQLTLINICFFVTKIYLSSSLPINNTELNTDVFKNISKSNEDLTTFKHESAPLELSQLNTSKLVIPLISLFELEEQEKHRRKKKSVTKKKKPVREMRNKLKQLMTNISNTFDDMDWYFALEQLENQTDVGMINSSKRKNSKYEVRRMNKVDDQNSDSFLDLFIQQMYDMNPVFIDKIRSRIDQEISSNKRRIRLAPLSGDSFNVSTSKSENFNVQSKTLIPQRKEIIKSIQIKDLIPSYNENEDDYYYENNLNPESFNNSSKSEKDGIISNESYKEQHELVVGDEDFSFESSNLSTTTSSTTTLETFYDLGDYYKESYEEGNSEMKDIEEYEINKDSPEVSTVNFIEEPARINKEIYRPKGKERRYSKIKERNKLKNCPRKLLHNRKKQYNEKK